MMLYRSPYMHAVYSAHKLKQCILISGFHRALLQSIAFINQLNALNYTKPRG